MNPVRPYFDKGNVEQNNQKLTYGNIKANMKINKFDTKSDTVSFLGNCNKPAKGLFEKFIDILNYPIKKSKENKLKKAAEEAAKQARLRTSWLKEKEIFEQHIKQTADDLLSEFRAKNNGIFEIEFPQSCVLYIRNHREHSLPKHHEAIVKFADGQHNKKLELYRFNYTYRKDCNLNQSAYSKKVNF